MNDIIKDLPRFTIGTFVIRELDVAGHIKNLKYARVYYLDNVGIMRDKVNGWKIFNINTGEFYEYSDNLTSAKSTAWNKYHSSFKPYYKG